MSEIKFLLPNKMSYLLNTLHQVICCIMRVETVINRYCILHLPKDINIYMLDFGFCELKPRIIYKLYLLYILNAITVTNILFYASRMKVYGTINFNTHFLSCHFAYKLFPSFNGKPHLI